MFASLLFKQNLPDDLPPEWQAIFESLAHVMDILALFEEDAVCTEELVHVLLCLGVCVVYFNAA